jgi:hypothetical protein
MRLEPLHPSRFLFGMGYLLSYLIATTMLFLILVVWRDFPWTLFQVIGLTASIVLVARLVAWWLG